MDGTTAPIVIDGLTKRFGRLAAVKSLSLSVPSGCVYGFLGLNGAGKTTTIRMLLDLLRPSAGHASILGHDCQADGLRARAEVGYLPAELRLYPSLTGAEVLSLFARLSARRVEATRQHELLERLRLPAGDLVRRVGEYSTGMKRKLGIVLAFQADPRLLVLDEPTEGLDPLMQGAFYELLADTSARGRTVFMSSHVLSEVERVCHRIAVLRAGELVLEAPVEDVCRLAPRTIVVTFAEAVTPPDTWPAATEVVTVAPARWELRTTAELGPLVATLAGLPVKDLRASERRLEDVVLGYYRGAA